MDAVNVTKESRRCVECGRLLASNIKQAITCCGRDYIVSRSRKRKTSSIPIIEQKWLNEVRSVCNRTCPHWTEEPGRNGGCSLSPTRPCDIWAHIQRGKGCFAAEQRFVSLGEFTEQHKRSSAHRFPEFNWPCKGGERVLCTIIIGDMAKRCAEYTLPRLERYAKRIDAELVIVDKDIYPKWPMGNKFFIGSVASQYDRTFYADIDVWIRDSCPNVFEVFPPGSIYKHRDQDHLEQGHLEKDSRILGHPGLVRNCWNSGVAILDRKHADIWTPPKQVSEFSHTLEQSTAEINIHLKGYKVTQLPIEFNCQLWTKDVFWKHYPTAHIIHLSGWRHKRFEVLERLKAEEGI